MFKRLLWLVIGASFGFGSSFWVFRSLRRAVDRYRPVRLAAGAAGGVRQLGADAAYALSEGRKGMREKEAALRFELGEPVAIGTGSRITLPPRP